MAIEIPNAFEAAGTFDGFDPSSNPDPIFTSRGVLPFDPASTIANLSGGFTRVGTAQYILGLERPIDILESACFVSCFPALKPVDLCISVVPGVPGDEGVTDGLVLVLGDVTGDDTIFTAGVWRTRDGLDGAQANLPEPPP